MDDFNKYHQMHSAGSSPGEVYRIAKADGADEITCIRLLRQVFSLSLVEAKTVIVEASGQSTSLEEYQSRLQAGIEQALEINSGQKDEEAE